jgi:hypothetical protein
MEQSLKGKTALVSGASRGIGRTVYGDGVSESPSTAVTRIATRRSNNVIRVLIQCFSPSHGGAAAGNYLAEGRARLRLPRAERELRKAVGDGRCSHSSADPRVPPRHLAETGPPPDTVVSPDRGKPADRDPMVAEQFQIAIDATQIRKPELIEALRDVLVEGFQANEAAQRRNLGDVTSVYRAIATVPRRRKKKG